MAQRLTGCQGVYGCGAVTQLGGICCVRLRLCVCVWCVAYLRLQRGGDPVEVFGLLAPSAPSSLHDGKSSAGTVENEPPSPTSSVLSMRSSACSEGGGVPAAGGKRSRIPTLGGGGSSAGGGRPGFADKTNTAAAN